MVTFTNYIKTSTNAVQTFKSDEPIEAGLFVYQEGYTIKVSDSTAENTIGVVMGESNVSDNRIGGHHSVAIQSAGVLVQREDDVEFEAGDVIYVSDNGKATTVGTERVGLAVYSYKTKNGISAVLMRAV